MSFSLHWVCLDVCPPDAINCALCVLVHILSFPPSGAFVYWADNQTRYFKVCYWNLKERNISLGEAGSSPCPVFAVTSLVPRRRGHSVTRVRLPFDVEPLSNSKLLVWDQHAHHATYSVFFFFSLSSMVYIVMLLLYCCIVIQYRVLLPRELLECIQYACCLHASVAWLSLKCKSRVLGSKIASLLFNFF